MGYSTYFTGSFKLNRKLHEDDWNYLIKFNETRRMARKLGPEYGVEGEFYVDGLGFMGQDHDASVIDSNHPPRTQPSLWCQWRPSDDGAAIVWDGADKFYGYVEWLQYIVKNFLEPKGYVLNGEMQWYGEDPDDRGKIVVVENQISTKIGRIVFE